MKEKDDISWLRAQLEFRGLCTRGKTVLWANGITTKESAKLAVESGKLNLANQRNCGKVVTAQICAFLGIPVVYKGVAKRTLEYWIGQRESLSSRLQYVEKKIKEIEAK